MHEKEQERETNTGKWLNQALPYCDTTIWHRQLPREAMLKDINASSEVPLLVFPDQHSIPVTEATALLTRQNKQPFFMVLEGTWQEARKMRRKSPWMDSITRVHLTPDNASGYRLRKNQDSGHLCTLEVAAELLKITDEADNARRLLAFFDHLMNVYQADKSGHAYYSTGTGDDRTGDQR